MRYRNIATGVILEPATQEVAALYESSPLYVRVESVETPPVMAVKEQEKPKRPPAKRGDNRVCQR